MIPSDPAERQRIVGEFRAEVESVRAAFIEGVDGARCGALTGRPHPDVVIACALIEAACWQCAKLVGRDQQYAVTLARRLTAYIEQLAAVPDPGGPKQ